MSFQYISIEGPIGAGKTAVAEGLARRLEANVILDEKGGQNPFLKDFHEGQQGSAFQAEVFFLLARYRQQQDLIQRRLFTQTTLCDYLFERSRLFAYLNLDDNELMIFEKLYGLLAEGAPRPDLAVYLQAPTDVLIRRIREGGHAEQQAVSEEYMQEINRAYNHYFFHYNRTPLLVVNTAEIDLENSAGDLDDVLKQIRAMGRGTQFYVPQVSNR
ncbi:MAG: deoxynucleoside kinase [Vicinamibacteria bacterium]|nr:deoxynucleoside kinase [Vicinamibacteria bacterium]